MAHDWFPGKANLHREGKFNRQISGKVGQSLTCIYSACYSNLIQTRTPMKQRLTVLLAFLLGLNACQLPEKPQEKDPRPLLLQRLDGTWIGKGQVTGEPVTYLISVGPVLNSAFSKIHMVDLSSPPQYEALVFIGEDPRTKTIITHWLDSFGAAYSIPHGTGKISDQTLEFTIPYPESVFLDRFIYDERSDSWKLEILSRKDSSSSWSVFAGYDLHRRTAGN